MPDQSTPYPADLAQCLAQGRRNREGAHEQPTDPLPAGHDHSLQEWQSAAYAHARRADDADAARDEAVQWAAAVEATLDRVREVRDTWAGYTLEPGQVRRLLDEVTRALCDEPAIVTITMDAAAHVLAQDGYDGGYPPGQYIGRLLTAWWSADPGHAARLATAYPVYGAAIALLHSPGGPEQLRAVATGRSTCRVAEVDGEPIRVFALGALSDEDAAVLIEGVADMRRRGKATEQQADACRLVDVDGEQVLVRGDGQLTAEDQAALAEVVAAARRRYAAEHPDDDAPALSEAESTDVAAGDSPTRRAATPHHPNGDPDSVTRYLVTATIDQKWTLWEQTAAVANWIEGRVREGGIETWLVTVYGEHATTVLDIARAAGATVEEIQGADDTETYELRVGEPGTGWQVST